ncbi:MAG: capsular polysaccharide biosynthesis protein, partial [Eubacterium sp.]|nr:capsular polysaccharide biosynthesis protein [Eubacterium sp.]
MVDFHTHILPGIDDGSSSMDETRELLNMELENGVTQIVFTPHFYADQMSIKTFLAKRQAAYEQVMQEMKDDTRFEQFYLGAEVAYFPGMSKAEQLEVLCVQGTKVLLIEMPFAQWTEEVYRELAYIVEKRKLTVILVHLERYAEFQKKKKVWSKVLELPIHVQINGGAV